MAELAQDEDVRGFGDQARLVANNITVLRRAGEDLVAADAVTVADVEQLHAALLPDEEHHGLRRVQNWIGGSSWHPLTADFFPPPPELVPELMDDLVEYLNGSVHVDPHRAHPTRPDAVGHPPGQPRPRHAARALRGRPDGIPLLLGTRRR